MKKFSVQEMMHMNFLKLTKHVNGGKIKQNVRLHILTLHPSGR